MSQASKEISDAFESVSQKTRIDQIFEGVFPEASDDFSDAPRSWRSLGVENATCEDWIKLSGAARTSIMEQIYRDAVEGVFTGEEGGISSLLSKISTLTSQAAALPSRVVQEVEDVLSSDSDATQSSFSKVVILGLEREILEVMNMRVDKKTRLVMIQVRHKAGTEWLDASTMFAAKEVRALEHILPRVP